MNHSPTSLETRDIPDHPGKILREEVIPETGLSKTAFANRLGMSRVGLHKVLSGKAGVSTMMALKLGRLLGTSAEKWLALQQTYDLAKTRVEKASELEKVEALDSA
ncbi:HigA family addiction module antitoxin [Tsuneonella sp. HG222]